MVPRAGAYDALGSLFRRERLDHVVGAAYLVRPYHLKVLALEHHVCPVAVRQVAVRHEGGGREYLAEGMLGRHDVVQRRKIFFGFVTHLCG